MKDRKASFSAALIATILATGAAHGGTISSSPSLSASLATDRERMLATSPERADLVAPNIVPGPMQTPESGGANDAPGPDAMGFLGLGISGVVALRRFRKLFF